jgi:hypothetical protein
MKLAPAAYGLSVLIVLGALGAWAMTGREGYTRWPDVKLEQTDAPMSEGEEDLFADIGFETEDEAEETPDIESRFAFGLVPGGMGPKYMISVASAVALAVGISGVATLITMKKKSKHTA